MKLQRQPLYVAEVQLFPGLEPNVVATLKGPGLLVVFHLDRAAWNAWVAEHGAPRPRWISLSDEIDVWDLANLALEQLEQYETAHALTTTSVFVWTSRRVYA